MFLEGLRQFSTIRLLGSQDPLDRVGVFSIDFLGHDNAEVSFLLEEDFGILTRCGLHCSPLAHRTFGTYPNGTVRFSFSPATTIDELVYTLDAIGKISQNI